MIFIVLFFETAFLDSEVVLSQIIPVVSAAGRKIGTGKAFVVLQSV